MSDARAIGGLAGVPDSSPASTAALGTRVGTALRDDAKDVANAGVAAVNGVRDASAATSNVITAPLRYGGGFARDVFNGLAGNPESPNAGQPLAGIAPQPLTRAVPSSAAGSATANLGGVNGSASTTTRAPGAVDPNATAAPVLKRPSLGGVQGSSLGTVKGDLPSDVYGGALAVDGTRLPYGAMVNGVPTFSDGSSGRPGVAGPIPRTMTDETIRSLGDRLNTAPAQVTPLMSDVLGYTPTQEQATSLRRAAPSSITGSRPSAAQFAASDLNSVASGDWRSAAGTTASNLRRDVQYAGTQRARRAAEQALGAQIGGTLHAGEQNIAAEAGASTLAAQQGGAMDLENLRGQYGLQQGAMETARAFLTRQPQQTTLSDGTIATLSPNGVATPARLPDGSLARAAVTRDDSVTKRNNEQVDLINKGVQDRISAYERAQANALPDEKKPVSDDMISQWRKQSALANGHNVVSNKAGQNLVYLDSQWRAL